MTNLLFARQAYDDTDYYIVELTKGITEDDLLRIRKVLMKIPSDLTLLGVGIFSPKYTILTTIQKLFPLDEVKKHSREYYGKEWGELNDRLCHDLTDNKTVSYSGSFTLLNYGTRDEYILDMIKEEKREERKNKYISELYKFI